MVQGERIFKYLQVDIPPCSVILFLLFLYIPYGLEVNNLGSPHENGTT
jgi:hypothetical protein